MVTEAADEVDASEIRGIAERLKLAMRAAGGNAQVAEMSGVPLRTLNMYMAGSADPKLTKLHRIATACGTSVDALLGRKPPSMPSSSDLVADGFGMISTDEGMQVPDGFVAVPFLRYGPLLGGGRASLPAETVAAEHFLFSRAWLRSLGVVADRAELLQAQGDSMYPTIHDGDLMLIDRGYGEVVHGKIYALVVNGLVIVKRVHYLAGGGMVLLSDNDRYPSETIRRDAVDQLSFQGTRGMVRPGYVSSAALLFLSAAVASAGEMSGLLAAKDVQDAEQLIAASITTGNHSEMPEQRRKLSRLLGQLLDGLDGDARFPCVGATQKLYNVSLDFDLPPARRNVALTRDLDLYREAMPGCEQAVGASPPNKPNLR